MKFSEIIDRYCTVFSDLDNHLWAYIPALCGCVPLRSPDFREYFFATSYNQLSLIPSNSQFHSILLILAGRARADALTARLPIARRVAEHCPSTFPDLIRLHLANSHDQFVTISPTGFHTSASPSVHFEHSWSAKALPVPLPPTDPAADPAAPLQLLRQYLNLASRADWLRCLGFLLACFRPSIPAPLALFQGPPSSGKSVAARLLRLFLDPSTTPFTPIPSSVRDLHSQARLNFLLVFDHISNLSSKLSDALCRLVSGAGVVLREPGAPASSPVTRSYKRPVILTTTGQFACPDDLAGHALTIHFAPLAPENRQPLDALQERLKDHYPAILAAICHAVSTALRRLPEMGHPTGRHPDMLAWAMAAAPALGCTPEEMREALDYCPPDPTIEAVTHLFANESEWTGTASDLLHLLPLSPHYSQPKGVTQHLKKRLPARGIAIHFHRSAKKRLITLTLHPSGTDDRLPSSVEAPHDASSPDVGQALSPANPLHPIVAFIGVHPRSSAANSLFSAVEATSGTDDRLPSSVGAPKVSHDASSAPPRVAQALLLAAPPLMGARGAASPKLPSSHTEAPNDSFLNTLHPPIDRNPGALSPISTKLENFAPSDALPVDSPQIPYLENDTHAR